MAVEASGARVLVFGLGGILYLLVLKGWQGRQPCSGQVARDGWGAEAAPRTTRVGCQVSPGGQGT